MTALADLKARVDPVWFARERLGFEPDAQQEAVLRGGQRGILNCSRQWGKSTVAAIKALHWATYHAGSLVLVASPTERQSGEFLLRVKELAGRAGMGGLRGDGHHGLSIVTPAGGRIVGLPASPDTVRGYSASMLIVDEAAMVEDALFAALTPTLAATGGSLWLLSTPNGPQGFFWRLWTKGGAEWVRVKAPAAGCPRIRASFLEDERAWMTEAAYRQNYCCEFTEREGAVFARELIEQMFTDREKAEVL